MSPETMISDDLAEYISSLKYRDLAKESRRQIERCFIDTVAVTIAGADSEAGVRAARVVEQNANGTGSASVLGHGFHASPQEAAFVNGTAGHGLDFDDVAEPMSNHPSTTMVPALFTVGQVDHASGPDIITAYLAGYETQYYLSEFVNPMHYEAGWHSTSTLGVFGVAAAVAHLRDLSRSEIRAALNIAASLPAGLKRNFGTMTKPMHAGAAARSGITAAFLAATGFTADDAAIDGNRGFTDLYTRPEGSERWRSPRLAKDANFRAHGVHVKKYPCCYFTHTSIAAVQDLKGTYDFTPNEVEKITVHASQGAHDALHHADPSTGLEAKFSMQHAVAAALDRDVVDLAAFENEYVSSPSVENLRHRVSFELAESTPYAEHAASVTIELKDGSEFGKHVYDPPGTWDDPLTLAELREKFLMCVTQLYDKTTAKRTFAICDSLRDCDDVAALINEFEGSTVSDR